GGPAPPLPPPAHWDGLVAGGALPAAGSPEEKAQAAMQKELFKAYDDYLNAKRADVLATLSSVNKVPFTAPAPAAGGAAAPPAGGAAAPAAASAPTGVVDIANAARAELERRYATNMDAASTTPAQLTDRGPLAAGVNLFNPYSEADRLTAVKGQL